MGEARILKTGDTVTPNEFEFTYTGDYNYKEGASGTIEIEFLTSGTFTLLKSTPFKPFDLCLVGGGGNGGGGSSNYISGGGGGYVENFYDIPVELNKAYPIVIGGSAGDTTGFGYIAKAGKSGSSGGSAGFVGGDGGSGGGAGYSGSTTFNNSSARYTNIFNVGKGQGKTTRAFGTGKLFGGGGGGIHGAGGFDGSDGVVEVTNNKDQTYKQYGGNGGGGAYSAAQNTTYQNGQANTGGGGGGGYYMRGIGGSGIAILRRRWSETIPVVDNNKNLEVKSYTLNY